MGAGAGAGFATGFSAGLATSIGATTGTGAGSRVRGASVRGSGASAVTGSGSGMAWGIWVGSAAVGSGSLAWACGLLFCCVGAELQPTSVSSSAASAVLWMVCMVFPLIFLNS